MAAAQARRKEPARGGRKAAPTREAVHQRRAVSFSSAPPVPGSEPPWKQYQHLPRDAKAEALLRSREALSGRVTYYDGETPSNNPTYPASGLNPRRVSSIYTEAITTGRVVLKADLDEQITRRDTHLRGTDSAMRSTITGKPVMVAPNGPSDLQRDLAYLGQALIDDIDNFDHSCFQLLKSHGCGFGAAEAVFSHKALQVAGRQLSVPGAWPQQIDEIYNRNFRFHPVEDKPLLNRANGTYVDPDVAPYKIVIHEGLGDGPVRMRGHLTCNVWMHMIKHDGLARLAQCLDWYGIPHPFAEMPWDLYQNEELKAATREAMGDFGNGNPYIKVKEVLWGFTQLPTGLDARGMHAVLWGLCNTEMSKATQGETLTTELGGVGSYNASETHEAVKGDIASMLERGLAATIRKWLRAVFVLNMGALCAAFGATPAQILGSIPKVYWLIHRAMDPETRQRMRFAAAAAGMPIAQEQEYRENGWQKPTEPGQAIPGKNVVVADGAIAVGELEAAQGVANPKDEAPASQPASSQRVMSQAGALAALSALASIPTRAQERRMAKDVPR